MSIIDMTGQRFGKLVVIKPTERRDHHGCAYWLCKCDCGNEKIVNGSYLRRGITKSCGCIRAENNVDRARKMGLATRKHFGCFNCGSDEHYAKGYCRKCYDKIRRGTLW